MNTKSTFRKNANDFLTHTMKNKGITLIALVITIIVLIILAMVSISLLLGENGIISKTINARVENAHATVWEQMSLKYTDYQAEKQLKRESDFINYLKGEGVIEEEQSSGCYVINIKALNIGKLALGNGTDGVNDVYKLEEVLVSTGNVTQLASIQDNVKLAETENNTKTYKVKYYGETGDRELGEFVDKAEIDSQSENEQIHNFKVGDYVQLPYDNGTIECMVLYDDDYNEEHDTDYGIQIISTDALGNGVTLGCTEPLSDSNDKEEAKRRVNLTVDSYNNAIQTLNDEAGKYVDQKNSSYVSSARCVGSVPSNPYSESEDYRTFAVEPSGYNMQFEDRIQVKIKYSDSNSKSDLDQLQKMENANHNVYLTTSQENYWLASRDTFESTVVNTYSILYSSSEVPESEYSRSDGAYFFDSMNWGIAMTSYTYKIRPVFTLKTLSNDKIYGNGTQDDPYRWTINK